MSVNSLGQAATLASPTASVERRSSPISGFGHVRRVLSEWRARAADRRAWRYIADEHIMSDIGISRAEFMREISKPFWRK